MTWQKVTQHINQHRVEVESKSGNTYPVETEHDHINDEIYTHMVNGKNEWDLWAWVNFDGENPVVEYVSSGNPQNGAPEKPPWEL